MKCSCGGDIVAIRKRENTNYADYDGNIRQSFQVGAFYIAGGYCEKCKIVYHESLFSSAKPIAKYPFHETIKEADDELTDNLSKLYDRRMDDEISL